MKFWCDYKGWPAAFEWSDQQQGDWQSQGLSIQPLHIVFCTLDFLIEQGHDFFIERQAASQHCEEYYSTTPYIQASTLVVSMPNDFRSSVVEATATGLQKFPVFHKVRQSKIRDFNDFIIIKQYIFRFEVPMTDKIEMRIFNSFNNLPEKHLHIILS